MVRQVLAQRLGALPLLEVGQVAVGGGQALPAQGLQLGGQRVLHRLHGVHAGGAGVEPDLAQARVQRAAGQRGGQDAAQPLQ